MPELPEVEITRLGLMPLINHKVSQVVIRNSSLRWPVNLALNSILKDMPLVGLQRRGKYIFASFPIGTLIIHLGMSGRLCIASKKSEVQKHDHVDIIFNGPENKILRYRDPRRFGSITWTEDDPYQHKLIMRLGPEPLDNEFSADYLYEKLRNKSVCIKNAIMNSHVVVGVGNIYASESLFQARVQPHRPAHKISKDEIKSIVDAIKDVIENAINKGGSTLNDFFDVDGKSGYFQNEHHVYARKGMPCYLCDHPILQITLGQRSSFYCKNCQK
jgi:formamidopyrimidine-DNA glycosylase